MIELFSYVEEEIAYVQQKIWRGIIKIQVSLQDSSPVDFLLRNEVESAKAAFVIVFMSNERASARWERSNEITLLANGKR